MTLPYRLLGRECGDTSPKSSIAGIYGDRRWVDQLDIVNELGGHTGCVNALWYVEVVDEDYLTLPLPSPEASIAGNARLAPPVSGAVLYMTPC